MGQLGKMSHRRLARLAAGPKLLDSKTLRLSPEDFLGVGVDDSHVAARGKSVLEGPSLA